MLTIEAYIAKRKNEDQLNEFNIQDRIQNLKTCVDYVFEYYNQYLDVTKIDEKTILNDEKLDKYRKTITQYEPELQEWLIDIYDTHNRQLNRSIVPVIKKEDLFYLYSSDSEFRSLSYVCYSKLINKHPFLKDQTEMLYLFLKDYQLTQSKAEENGRVSFYSEIDLWIESTWKKYRVDILLFCFDWVDRFYENKDKWPADHRKKSASQWEKYDYDYRKKSNLFNLDSLYTKISAKPFLKGKKQYLEIVMMYYWLHDIVGDDQNYWQEYLEKHSTLR